MRLPHCKQAQLAITGVPHREGLYDERGAWPALSSQSHVCMLSRFSRVQLNVTPGTVACQASLSMGFSWQEYWSGLPCPPPGDLPKPGMKPTSLKTPSLAGRSLAPPGKPNPQCLSMFLRRGIYSPTLRKHSGARRFLTGHT